MSRLDRLFTLLSSSTSSSTSTLAAEQLGEIQKTCPEQIHVLLSKLHPLFRSSKWEVRIAASKALANVLKNVQIENQQFLPKDETQEIGDEKDLKWMKKFDLDNVVKNGLAALSSTGGDDDDDSVLDVETQKKNLSSILGNEVAKSEVIRDQLPTYIRGVSI